MRELDCRIALTEKCNASCKHCFNADARHGKDMDIDKFLEFANQNIDTLNQRDFKSLLLKHWIYLDESIYSPTEY